MHYHSSNVEFVGAGLTSIVYETDVTQPALTWLCRVSWWAMPTLRDI
ncbi:MAG: hypothetical protein RH949_18180 [Coleofasciculus sp. A1-SPW-01]